MAISVVGRRVSDWIGHWPVSSSVGFALSRGAAGDGCVQWLEHKRASSDARCERPHAPSSSASPPAPSAVEEELVRRAGIDARRGNAGRLSGDERRGFCAGASSRGDGGTCVALDLVVDDRCSGGLCEGDRWVWTRSSGTGFATSPLAV